ncbi:MAG: OB-fold nucleic acid binding domain-containing protein [Salinirussus sp.]
MGSCIICGKSVDGRICDLHQEDVVFEFRGSHPDELSTDRFYRGTVDGYAEFGVFVDIGDRVTGLLHKSELDRRLDSLDREPGDTVFVKVQNVRDNGNVDLGWSIRQDESAFRGTLIDDPDADTELLVDEDEDEGDADGSGAGDEGDPGGVASSPVAESAGPPGGSPAPGGGEAGDGGTRTRASPGTSAETDPEPAASLERVAIAELSDHVGSVVRIEGEVASARQTSGPTVFELRDETGAVDCAAFEEAGVRAYPGVAEEDIVRIEGEVERRRGELQVETEALVALSDEERAAVVDRMDEALVERARPESIEPLAPDPAVESATDGLREVATEVRRAVLEGRPVVVRHSATADGYAGGAAIERATLPLIRDYHDEADATYHYFDRRPLEGSVYDMADATQDTTNMLSSRERHGESLPLFVFVAAGGTDESLDGYELLGLYGARRAVVDGGTVDEAVADAVDALATPADGETTATALAASVAAGVDSDARPAIDHLPAVSFWETPPEAYADLAASAGDDPESVRERREALALEAYYQSYEDKRQLVGDLLFGDEGLAGRISAQFRTRMDAEVETAEANLERRDVGGETVLVLDTDAYTHRYEFPPDRLLLDELHRRHREEAAALLGVGTDTAFLRTDADIDVREVVDRARADAPAAGLDARGAREGRIEFLSGERETTEEALVSALAATL